MDKRIKASALILCCLAWWLVSATPASATRITINPTIAVRQEYNDNINFDADLETEDWITTISPGLQISDTTERLQAVASARWDGLIYADNTDLNTINQFYNGRVHYQLTRRNGIGASASYSRDTRIDSDIETTGLLKRTGTRKRQRYGASWDYMITELTQSVLSYDYRQDRYEEPDDETNRTHVVSWGLTSNLSRLVANTWGLTNFSYMRYDLEDRDVYPNAFAVPIPLPQTLYVDNTSTYDVFQGTMGARHAFSERGDISANVGASYTASESDINQFVLIQGSIIPLDPESRSAETWGFVGNAELTWRNEFTTFRTGISQDMQPASGNSGLSERTSVTLNVDQRITENWRGILNTGYYFNRINRYSSIDVDEQTFRIQPALRYNFGHDFYAYLTYIYTTVFNKENDTTRTRNMVYLKIEKDFEFEF